MVRAKAAPAKAGLEHEQLSVLFSGHKNTPDVIGQAQLDSGAIVTTHLLSLMETRNCSWRALKIYLVCRFQTPIQLAQLCLFGISSLQGKLCTVRGEVVWDHPFLGKFL